jgi:hypothetical protein
MGVPLALEIRDLWPQTLIDIGDFSPRHPFVLLLERIERQLYSRAQLILTLRPRAESHLYEKGMMDIQKVHPFPMASTSRTSRRWLLPAHATTSW